MNRRGFTLVEVVVATAVSGLVALLLGFVIRYMLKNQVGSQAQAELQDDVNRITQLLNVTVGMAGDGVANSAQSSRSIFVSTGTDAPVITFFYKDVAGTGLMNSKSDLWMSYSLQNGQLLEQTYATDVSSNIAPSVQVASSLFTLSPNATISKLQFNFYSSGPTSGSTPQEITDASAASYVRVHMELQKSGAFISKDAWIYLANVINAIQIP